ncbi:MAG: aldehyde dehydrogenase family protein [Planctomycetota bacterium]|jgi:succinate-semialdehyde dehydrogenase/glutarate-semialdehyde dehydrogenase|nr:aldehyde dehydrogenase family protein [Planctomycetota bacterium]
MKMFIDGTRVDASDGAAFDVVNSATQEFIDTAPRATEQDVRKAIDAAVRGKRAWAATPVHERSRLLTACADAIDARREELARSLSSEMGKIIREAKPEIRVCAQILRGFAEKAAHHYGHTMTEYQVGTENDIIFTRREPLGIVACISPFNYPVELCTQKFASALAAGNAVIIKPASDNPLTVMRVVEICLDCGLPGDVLQLVTGGGAMVGELLAKSDKIQAISLTGSTPVGLQIAELGARTLKRVFLELGGNDPFIVFDDADLEAAICDAAMGRVQNAGQTCCAPKRFLVHNPVKRRFVEGVIQRIKNLKLGSPLDESTDLGSLISERAAGEVHKQVRLTVEQGATLLHGGRIYDKTYYEPTILDDVTPDMDVARDLEIFGPVLPIIGFDGEDEAVEIANATCYGLQAGVMTSDMGRAMRVASRLACGGVVINSSGNYRHMDQPFGGCKMSGVGREGVSVTLDEMTQEKSYILKNVLQPPPL